MTEQKNSAKDRTLALAVALTSAASLAYELLLLRYFALMYWDHFAHLIISMALLGFGASGTVLALAQHRLLCHFHRWSFISGLLFAFSLLAATSLAGRIGFNPPAVIWEGEQLLRLAVVFLLTMVPFLCAGTCIGLAMRWRSDLTARLYQADLTGAACGALLLMGLLFFLPPQDAVRILALLALLSPALILVARPTPLARTALAGSLLLLLIWPHQWLEPAVSPFKELSRTLLIPGVEIAAQTDAPTGQFAALTSRQIPFRLAPGLSMRSPVMPPDQVLLFRDGHPAGPINHVPRDLESMAYLRWTPMGLPYALLNRPKVLILGSGGGSDVGHALLEGARQVDAVEPNHSLTGFLRGQFASFSGNLYQHDRVRLLPADLRGSLAATQTTFDLIQISPLGTASPPAGDGQALQPSHLFTREGISLALSRLPPQGILAISMPFESPPRGAVKMVATVTQALQKDWNTLAPSQHVAVIRSWNICTLIVSPSPLAPDQRTTIRDFCRSRAFDLAWLPDIAASEVNRFHVLPHPFLYEAVQEIWHGRNPSRLSAFNLTPATDDRPWFGHFFRWPSLPRLWRERSTGTASLLEWEYLLLWMSLAVALTLSLLAIVLPLKLRYRRDAPDRGQQRSGFALIVYFASLGLAFFFLEMVFMQQFILFLNHPVTAMAVIVPSFLFFAGCGSGVVQQLALHGLAEKTSRQNRTLLLAIGMILIIAALYLWLLPLVFRIGAAWPLSLRVLLTTLLIGGLAFWMGMPFPLGMQHLGRQCQDMMPLAWGVNGCFSVISAIAATILAVEAGFRVVTIAALVLYGLAAAVEHHLQP